MHLTCHCLNVSLKVIGEGDRLQDMIVKPETLHLSEDAFEDQFFDGSVHSIAAVIAKDESAIIERLPMFIRKRTLDNWEVRTCLLCNTYTYATSSSTPVKILVSLKLLSDERDIAERKKCAEYSSAFQVVLPKKTSIAPLVDTFTAGNSESGFILSGANNVSRYALHVVQDAVAQCLKREQQAMEERIQKFTDEQQAAFEQFKAKAKSDRATMLSLLAYHQSAADYHMHYDDDDENDSAVPLSPLSLRSGDPSPAFLGGVGNGYCLSSTAAMVAPPFNNNNCNQQFYFYDVCLPPTADMALSRPKALSNPASLTSWKRKRHSGGSGKAPALTSYPEEQQDTIFSFEDHENIAGFYHLPDDDDDTDDSGTSSGDYSKFYPSIAPTTVNFDGSQKIADNCDATDFNNFYVNNNHLASPKCVDNFFGKSLPVAIASSATTSSSVVGDNNKVPVTTTVVSTDKYCRGGGDGDYFLDYSIANNEVFAENGCCGDEPAFDVGASMMALARSIQAEDDPERLFGERPHRRRYKTGTDDVTGAGRSGQRSIVTTTTVNGHRRPSAF